jgi:hypothetical protein
MSYVKLFAYFVSNCLGGLPIGEIDLESEKIAVLKTRWRPLQRDYGKAAIEETATDSLPDPGAGTRYQCHHLSHILPGCLCSVNPALRLVAG